VLRREKFRRYLTIDEVEQYVAGLASQAETHANPEQVTPIARNPSDDYLIALAREAEADAIVSGDADLLVLEHLELPIVSPSRFVDELRYST